MTERNSGSIMMEVISGYADEFVANIKSEDGEEPYLQEAIVKIAIRDFTWALCSQFPNQIDEIQEQLDLMSKLVTEKWNEGISDISDD